MKMRSIVDAFIKGLFGEFRRPDLLNQFISLLNYVFALNEHSIF